MNPRNAVLVIAATTVLLPAFAARAQATNPPYLSQIPSVERVRAEIKGTDAMDTAARQMGAFWQLQEIIKTLSGLRWTRGQLTPDEGRLIGQYRLGYGTAEQPYAHIPKSPSHPDKERWFKAHTFYENDPGFRGELLDKFFTEEFRAAYYRATGRPRSSSRPQGNAPAAAAAKPPSTAGPTGRPANTAPSVPAGGSADDYIAQGNRYRDAKNYTAAAEAYKKSISLQPSARAYNALGLVYLDGLKQPENSVAAFQQVVRLKPDDAVGHLNLGLAYNGAKQFEKAVGAYREAIRLKPDNDAAFNQLGSAYYELEQYSEAATAFQQAVRLAPNDAVYHHNLGFNYAEMGRKEEALQVLKSSVNIFWVSRDGLYSATQNHKLPKVGSVTCRLSEP
jgi:tetratricopeptide (TPR) repeat protein